MFTRVPSGLTPRTPRGGRGSMRVVLAAALLAGGAVGSEVRVQGQTEFSAVQVVTLGSGIRAQGVLVDDLGKPVVGAEVQVALNAGAAATHTCAPGAATDPPGVLHTDGAGVFCGVLTTGTSDDIVRFVFAGSPLLRSASHQAKVRAEESSVELDLGSKPLRFDVGKAEHRVRVGTRPGVVPPHQGEPLPISLVLLRDGVELPLGSPQAPMVGQVATFTFPSSRLPPPGPGRLIARFSGTTRIAASSTSVVVQVVAVADLGVVESGASSHASASAPLDVAVRSAAGAVPNGWIEARFGEDQIALGEVSNGSASLVVPIGDSRERSLPIVLTYLPKEPWWLPGEPVRTSVVVGGTPPWKLLPWGVVLVAIAAMLLRSWSRPRRDVRRSPELRPAPRGSAAVAVVASHPEADAWWGTVVDAHDGAPIAAATVNILLPSFDGKGTRLSGTTDSLGAFRVGRNGLKLAEGATLHLEAPTHSEMQKPLPGPGQLHVTMVSRRRSILRRLVKWAARNRFAQQTRSEATPEQVRQQAERERRTDVATWARTVELGAYGSATPNADFERGVTEKEPLPPTQ